MKLFKNSSPQIMFWLLSIALLSSLTLGILTAGGVLFSLIKGNPMLPSDAFPVNIVITNTHNFVNNTKDIYVGDLSGQLFFVNPSIGLQMYSLFYTIIFWLSLSYIIFLMMKLVRTVMKGNPFVKENGKRLRIIALIFIFVPMILDAWRIRIISSILPLIKIENIRLMSYSSEEILHISLVVGLFFIVLSEVFRIGTSLKEENELTV